MGATFLNPGGLAAPGGYSHVGIVPAGTRTIYVAGQVPVDAQGRVIGEDARTQARQVFRNLQAALDDAGATFADVVKLTTYVVRASDLAAVREVRGDALGPGTAPVSTLVVVAALARPEFLLEVEAIAVAP